MKTSKLFKQAISWVLVLLLTMPVPVFAQDASISPKKFPQEQLDQIMAPVALYPDALLAQVLMAATYPMEVVLASRWVTQNKALKGEQLNNALDKQPWDPSVKALTPFPNVLAMMSDKLEWTQTVGDAFLEQEKDVMDTVQKLRQKAYDEGNLKNTEQQKVVVEKETIRVESARPEVIYVPVYDPWTVYGTWWWPGYPPYIVYPYQPGMVLAQGIIWFSAACLVGAVWGNAWGHWDWGHRRVYVNANRTVNINRTTINISSMRTTAWAHDPVHRRGVAYRGTATAARFGQMNRDTVESRRTYRGFESGAGSRAAAPARTVGVSGKAPTRTGEKVAKSSGGTASRAYAGASTSSRSSSSVSKVASPSGGSSSSRASTNLSKATSSAGVSASRRTSASVSKVTSPAVSVAKTDKGSNQNAFNGVGQGSDVRRQSSWGATARSSAVSTGGMSQGNAGSGVGSGSSVSSGGHSSGARVGTSSSGYSSGSVSGASSGGRNSGASVSVSSGGGHSSGPAKGGGSRR
ncbi:MAG: DUF3300 domain-containing protein [Syntrophus sp. (in: bacteria)]